MSADTVFKDDTFYNNVKELLSPPAPSSRAHETDQYESDEDDHDYYDDDDPVITPLRNEIHDALLSIIDAIVRFFDKDHAIHNIDPAVVADNWERAIWNESYEVEDYQRRAKVALDEGDTYEQDAKGIDICPGAAPGDFFYATMKKHMRDQNVPNQAQHEQPAAVDQVKEALLNSLEFRKGQLSGPDIQRRRFRLSFQESLQGFVSQLPPGDQLKLLDVIAVAAAMETDEWEKAHGLEQQYTNATEDLERELDMWATCWDSTDEDEDNQLTGQQRFENYVRITHQGKYIQTQEEIDLELILLAGFEEDEEDAANMSTEDAYADPTEYDYVQSLSQKSSAAAGEVNALESPASPPLWDQGPNENVEIGSDHEQGAGCSRLEPATAIRQQRR
jgi:hypothetical protein